MSDLEHRLEHGALWITFNRPEVHNALTNEMAEQTAELIEQAGADPEVRVVVLTGHGRAFSTGADVGGEDAHERFDEETMDRANRVIRAIVNCDRPVIAAVNGVAAGVSASAAFACDLIVAAESASFLLPFARIGLMPDGGANASVAAAIGRARTMRMALLADPLTARKAYKAGLITHVTTDQDFPSLVGSLVHKLSAGPPLALTAAKHAVNAATLDRLEHSLDRERGEQVRLFGSADAAEGMRAFSEKRRPTFRGE